MGKGALHPIVLGEVERRLLPPEHIVVSGHVTAHREMASIGGQDLNLVNSVLGVSEIDLLDVVVFSDVKVATAKRVLSQHGQRHVRIVRFVILGNIVVPVGALVGT